MMFAFDDVLSATAFKFKYSSFVYLSFSNCPAIQLLGIYFVTFLLYQLVPHVLCAVGETSRDDCSLGAETNMTFGAETNMIFGAETNMFSWSRDKYDIWGIFGSTHLLKY